MFLIGWNFSSICELMVKTKKNHTHCQYFIVASRILIKKTNNKRSNFPEEKYLVTMNVNFIMQRIHTRYFHDVILYFYRESTIHAKNMLQS